jgi:hypothetical protein
LAYLKEKIFNKYGRLILPQEREDIRIQTKQTRKDLKEKKLPDFWKVSDEKRKNAKEGERSCAPKARITGR